MIAKGLVCYARIIMDGKDYARLRNEDETRARMLEAWDEHG